MNKCGNFSRSDRVITVISTVWLIVSCFLAIVTSDDYTGAFDFGEFSAKFLITGLLPIVLISGVKWILSSSKNKQ